MLFPYEPRASQLEIVDFVRSAVEKGSSVVFESGTGTGKTVCALTGVLETTLDSKRKVVYLTRTKSQQKQVISECRKISEKRSIVSIAVQGRNDSTCPFMKDDPELATGTPEEMSRLCSELKKKKGLEGCPYYSEMDPGKIQNATNFLKKDHPDSEELTAYAVKQGLCPYELMKVLLSYADVVVAPYPFIMMPRVRGHFLQWLNACIEDIVIIVDEAHNVPDYLRDIMTAKYTETALSLMEKESSKIGDPDLLNGIRAPDVAKAFRQCMNDAISEYLRGEDGLIPPYYLEEGMMTYLSVSSVSLDKIYRALVDIGETVAEKKRLNRKLPRSYMGSFGRFLQMWTASDDEMFVKLITEPPNASFESYCMDPAPAAEPFRQCYASVHMSGTLQPIEHYTQMLDITARRETFPSPFDPSNLMTLHVEDSTTKYDEMLRDPDNMRRLKDHVVRIISSEKRNSAVFFPSYSMMESFIRDGVPERLNRTVYYEKQDQGQPELMDEIERFKVSGNGVLFAVSGGRVSEGIDFPDRDLEIAVLIGIPYPKPCARINALVRYCDIMHGDGWGIAIRTPTVRKMRQTIGRLIRSETDRGVAVILDKRAAAINELNAKPSADPGKDVNEFFSRT